jgi:hypothetical protein
MADDTGATRRMNYFNSQLLDESDFAAEQSYHLGMRRRLNLFLHTFGVAGDGGLRVTKSGDRRLRIGAGLALDREGRELVLAAERDLDLDAVKARAGSTVFVTLRYAETFELPVTDAGGGAMNFRRMEEKPLLDVSDKRPPDDGAVLLLAAVGIDRSGNVAEVDNAVRTFAGSVIDPRSEPTVRKLQVTSDVRANANLAVGGDLAVSGATDLRGELTARVLKVTAAARFSAGLGVDGDSDLRGKVTARALEVTTAATVTGGLRVDGVCDLRSNVNVGVDLAVAQKLSVSGQVGIGTTAPTAGLEIDKKGSNDTALKLTSSGPGHGCGLLLENTATSGARKYRLFVSNFGHLILGDETSGKDVWRADTSGTLSVNAGLRVNAGQPGSLGVVIERAGVASYGLTISSTKDFGAGLQLVNLGGGRKYGIYSNNKGEFVVGDDSNARAVFFVDLAGKLHADVIGLSSRAAKKDIERLSEQDGAEILKQVLATPLFRYRYRSDDDAAPTRLGVMAEEAPPDIVDAERKNVVLTDYLGFLFAGLQAQALEVQALKAALAAERAAPLS